MWFSKPEGASVALIDIGSSSVAGALAYLAPGSSPVMCYTTRLPLNHDTPLTLNDRMLRALGEVGECMVREGAPQLRQIAGQGSVERIVVSVSSPWQESSILTRKVQPASPFTFTKSLAVEALSQDTAPEGRTLNQTLVATFLNGYATRNPYGKRATRAEMVILSSMLDTGVLESVERALSKLFHTKKITYTGFAPLCYAVLRDLYPHEREFLVLSVTGEATDVASVKRGHIVDVGTLPHGTNTLQESVRRASSGAVGSGAKGPASASGQPSISNERNERFAIEAQKAETAWVEALAKLLREFAVRHALPRTIFLVADIEVRGFLRQALDSPALLELWLSDEPVSVLPVEPSHFTPHLKTQGLAEGDTFLGLLALYASTDKPE